MDALQRTPLTFSSSGRASTRGRRSDPDPPLITDDSVCSTIKLPRLFSSKRSPSILWLLLLSNLDTFSGVAALVVSADGLPLVLVYPSVAHWVSRKHQQQTLRRRLGTWSGFRPHKRFSKTHETRKTKTQSRKSRQRLRTVVAEPGHRNRENPSKRESQAAKQAGQSGRPCPAPSPAALGSSPQDNIIGQGLLSRACNVGAAKFDWASLT